MSYSLENQGPGQGTANPAISSPTHSGPKNVDTPAFGLIELVGRNHQVVKTWKIRHGDCLIGSSPDSGIRIQAPNIGSQHAKLSFGRRHTLVKSLGGNLWIDGRLIREALIDRPTIIDLGGVSIRVCPPSSSTRFGDTGSTRSESRFFPTRPPFLTQPDSGSPNLDPIDIQEADQSEPRRDHHPVLGTHPTENLLPAVEKVISSLVEPLRGAVDQLRASVDESRQHPIENPHPAPIDAKEEFARLESSLSERIEKRIDAMVSEIERLRNDNHQLLATAEVSKQRSDEQWQLQVQEACRKIDQYEALIGNLRSERDEAHRQTTELTNEIARLTKEKSQLDLANAEQQTQHRQLAEQLSQLDLQLRQVQENAERNASDWQSAGLSLQDQLVHWQQQAQLFQQQALQYQQQSEQYQQQSEQSHDRALQLEKHTQQLEAEISRREALLFDLEQKFALPSPAPEAPSASNFPAHSQAEFTNVSEELDDPSSADSSLYDRWSQPAVEEIGPTENEDHSLSQLLIHSLEDESQAFDILDHPSLDDRSGGFAYDRSSLSTPYEPQDVESPFSDPLDSSPFSEFIQEDLQAPTYESDSSPPYPASSDELLIGLESQPVDSENGRSSFEDESPFESPAYGRASYEEPIYEMPSDDSDVRIESHWDSEPESLSASMATGDVVPDFSGEFSASSDLGNIDESEPDHEMGSDREMDSALEKDFESQTSSSTMSGYGVGALGEELEDEPFELPPTKTNPPAPVSQPESATVASGEEEDSIEAYMQQLLQRVRGSSENSPPTITSPKTKTALTSVGPKTSQSPTVSLPSRTTSTKAASEQSMGDANSTESGSSNESRGNVDESGTIVRATPAEKTHDMAAFRELANNTARKAIERSDRRRLGSEVFFKAAVAMIGFVGGMFLIMVNGLEMNMALIGAVAGFIVAALWGFDALNLSKNMLILPPPSDATAASTDATPASHPRSTLSSETSLTAKVESVDPSKTTPTPIGGELPRS